MTKFTCASCERTFVGTKTSEELTMEFQKAFPNVDLANAVRVCDDCHMALCLLKAMEEADGLGEQN